MLWYADSRVRLPPWLLISWLVMALIGTRASVAQGQAATPRFAEIATLGSGLRVATHVESGTGAATVCSSFPAGLTRDAGYRGELSRAVAATVREGGRRSQGAEYTRLLESRGARSHVFLGADRVEFCTEVPSHELPLALWLEVGRAEPYAFTEQNFGERQRELSLGSAEDPFEEVARATRELAFPLLSPASERVSLETARRFHSLTYGLERAVLSLAGDFEPKAALAQIERTFGEGSVRGSAADSVVEAPPRQTSPRYLSLEDPSLVMPIHERAWVVPGAGAAERAALAVLGELLAGNSDSVLEEALIAPGLARSARTRLESRGAELLFSIVVEVAAARHETDLVTLLDQALLGLRSGPIRADQLERARKRLSLRRSFELESGLGQARWLAAQASGGLSVEPSEVVEAEARVTAAEVRRMIDQYLLETRRVVVELLPKEARDPFRVAPPRFHVVAEGEALARIAKREGISLDELLRLNGLDKKKKLQPGQKLKLPPAKPKKVHRVKKGDTLLGIAKRYGVSVDAIRRDNGLKKSSVLRAGADLTIPRGPDAK